MANDFGYKDLRLARLGLGGTELTGVGDDVPAQPAKPYEPVASSRNQAALLDP